MKYQRTTYRILKRLLLAILVQRIPWTLDVLPQIVALARCGRLVAIEDALLADTLQPEQRCVALRVGRSAPAAEQARARLAQPANTDLTAGRHKGRGGYWRGRHEGEGYVVLGWQIISLNVTTVHMSGRKRKNKRTAAGKVHPIRMARDDLGDEVFVGQEWDVEQFL
jgi:hypothetical protein